MENEAEPHGQGAHTGKIHVLAKTEDIGLNSLNIQTPVDHP